MKLSTAAIKQLAREQVDLLKGEDFSLFGKYYTWEELEKVLIEFAENSILKKYDDLILVSFLKDWELGDLPFENTIENKIKLFHCLPKHVQDCAVENGVSDTVFRDDAFSAICNNMLLITAEEYYHSATYTEYKKTGNTISID